MVLGAGFAIIKQFIYADILDPDGFGLYAFIYLLQSYAVYFCTIGFNEGIVRQLTLLRAKNLNIEADLTRNKVVSQVLLLVLSMGTIYSIGVLLLVKVNNPLFAGLLLNIPFSLSNILFNLIIVDLRAKNLPKAFAFFLAIRNLFLIIIGVSAAKLGYGFEGILIVESIVSFIMFLFIAYSKIIKFRWDFSCTKSIYSIARIGLPFNFSSLLRNVGINADKWYIASIFSFAMLGEYTFVMTMISGALVLSSIIGIVLEPFLLTRFSQGISPPQILKTGVAISITIGLIMSAAAFPIIYLYNLIIPHFFQSYTETINLFPFAYMGATLMVMNIFDHVTFTYGKGRMLFLAYIINVTFFIFLCAIVTSYQPTLVNFSIAFCFSRLVNLIMSFLVAFKLSVASVSLTKIEI